MKKILESMVNKAQLSRATGGGSGQNAVGAFGASMCILALEGRHAKGKNWTISSAMRPHCGPVQTYNKSSDAMVAALKSIGVTGTPRAANSPTDPDILCADGSKFELKHSKAFDKSKGYKLHMECRKVADRALHKKINTKIGGYDTPSKDLPKLIAALKADPVFYTEFRTWILAAFDGQGAMIPDLDDVNEYKIYIASPADVDALVKSEFPASNTSFSPKYFGATSYNGEKGLDNRPRYGFKIPSSKISLGATAPSGLDAVVTAFRAAEPAGSNFAKQTNAGIPASNRISQFGITRFILFHGSSGATVNKITQAANKIKKGTSKPQKSTGGGRYGTKSKSAAVFKKSWKGMLKKANIPETKSITIGSVTLPAKEFAMWTKNRNGNWAEIVQLVDDRSDLSSYSTTNSPRPQRQAQNRTQQGGSSGLTGTWQSNVGRKITKSGRLSRNKKLTKADRALFNKWRQAKGTNSVAADRITFAGLAEPDDVMDKNDWAVAKESKQYSLKYQLFERMEQMGMLEDENAIEQVIADIESGEYSVADFLDFAGVTDDEIFPEDEFDQEEF